MERKEYSAGAVKVCFWFSEFRKVVALLNEGNSLENVKDLNQRENIFSAPTPLRANQIFSTVSARVNSLDSSFYPLFLKSDLAAQKLFALAGAMADDTLFFDFVYEVIREKMIIGTYELSDSDVRVFFKNKQVQSEKAARWTDETLNRLGRCYRTMLYEAGVIDKSKLVRKIFRPILTSEFRQWLEDHEMGIFINALTGVREWRS
ncbi:MAG: DUF1819 family protein [Oscillibacter sp.]|jgi:hypothetical protein|nr:DUF1819 family protein [Oscillibacter sp.]